MHDNNVNCIVQELLTIAEILICINVPDDSRGIKPMGKVYHYLTTCYLSSVMNVSHLWSNKSTSLAIISCNLVMLTFLIGIFLVPQESLVVLFFLWGTLHLVRLWVLIVSPGYCIHLQNQSMSDILKWKSWMSLTQTSVAFHKLLTFSQSIYTCLMVSIHFLQKRQFTVSDIPILNKSLLSTVLYNSLYCLKCWYTDGALVWHFWIPWLIHQN